MDLSSTVCIWRYCKRTPFLSYIQHLHACMLTHFSHVQLCATLWTVARQAPLSVGFSRQDWVGCHVLLQGIFPTQGSNSHLLRLLHWQSGSLLLMPPGKPYIQHRKYQLKNLCILPAWLYCPVFHLSRPRTLGRKASCLKQLTPSSSLYFRNSYAVLTWNLAYNGFYYPVCLFCLPDQTAKSKAGVRSSTTVYPLSLPKTMHWQSRLSKCLTPMRQSSFQFKNNSTSNDSMIESLFSLLWKKKICHSEDVSLGSVGFSF